MSDFEKWRRESRRHGSCIGGPESQKETAVPENGFGRGFTYHKGPMTRGDWLWVIGMFAIPFISCIVIVGLKSGLSRALDMMEKFFVFSIGMAAVFGIYFLLKGIVLGLIWLCRRLLGSAKKEKDPEVQTALQENGALPPEYSANFDRDGRDIFDRGIEEFDAGHVASERERGRN